MKIPFSITASSAGPKAEIRITGHIGWEIDSESFRKQIDDIIASGVNQATIYINSPGGSVFDANEIVNILSRFKKRTCVGGAIVASAASYIACNCDTFEMPENGMLMIHRPQGFTGGNVEDLQSYTKLLSDMEKNYKALFLAKAKDKPAFEKAWAESDYWLTAKEAVAQGFATSVKQKVNYDKDITDMLTACGCPVDKINQISNNKNKMNILDFLKNLFGLSDAANEQDVINVVKPLNDKVKTLTDENKSLTERLKAYEQKDKDAQALEAKSLLDAAVLDGRLNADTRKPYEAFFASNFADAKAALGAMPKRESVAGKVTNSTPVDKYAKSWSELDKAGLLASLKADNYELFKEKYKEQFGNYPKE